MAGTAEEKDKRGEENRFSMEELPEELEEEINSIVEERVRERLEEEMEKQGIQQQEQDEPEKPEDESMSRRDFLKKAGLGAAGLGALSFIPSASALNIRSDDLEFFGADSTPELKVNDGGPVEILNSNLDITSDLRTTGGTVIWDSSNSWIPESVLENNSVTVNAGNQLTGGGSVSLGGSITIDLNEGSGSGLDADTVDGSHASNLGSQSLGFNTRQLTGAGLSVYGQVNASATAQTSTGPVASGTAFFRVSGTARSGTFNGGWNPAGDHYSVKLLKNSSVVATGNTWLETTMGYTSNDTLTAYIHCTSTFGPTDETNSIRVDLTMGY